MPVSYQLLVGSGQFFAPLCCYAVVYETTEKTVLQ